MDFSYAKTSFCSKCAVSSASQGTVSASVTLKVVGLGFFLSFLLCIYFQSVFIKTLKLSTRVFSLSLCQRHLRDSNAMASFS